MSDTQKQVGVPVKQAAPLLTHDFARLLQDLRQRAQSAGSMSARIEITRGIALFSLVFESMRRGYDLPGIFYHGLAGIAATRVGRTYF